MLSYSIICLPTYFIYLETQEKTNNIVFLTQMSQSRPYTNTINGRDDRMSREYTAKKAA